MLNKFLYLYLVCIFCIQDIKSQQNNFQSPCPDIFVYEAHPTDIGKWYGTITVKSGATLYGLWIDILLDREADSVENTLGEVVTLNNKDFKIENKNQVLPANSVMTIRIFVKYNKSLTPPKIKILRMNGRQICTDPTIVTNHQTTPSRTSTYNTDNTRTQGNRNHGALPLGTNDSYNYNKQSGYDTTRSSTINEVYGVSNSGGESIHSTRDRATNTESVYRQESNIRSNVGSSNSNKNRYSTSTQTETNYNTQNRNVQSGVPSVSRDTIQPISGSRDVYSGDSRVINEEVSRSRPSSSYDRSYQPLATTPRSRTQRPNNNHNYRYDTGENDYGDSSTADRKDNNNDYFEGDFRLPPEAKINPTPLPKKTESINECGKVAVQPAPLVVGGQGTSHGQWPWHVAIYQTQTVDSKYICGGSLVTTSHVVTAAHCVTRKNSNRLVNAQTLTIYLGKYNLRKSSDAVQILLVRKIFVHPDYNATNFYADVSVLKLSRPSEYTVYVRPVCMWKETETDLSYVVEKEGTVVGWGFDQDGHVTEELTLVKMPIVRQSTCLWSFKEFYTHFTSEKSYCAGYENGTSVCNGDSGGGMVFPDNNIQDRTPTWRLRGLVSISVAKQNEYRCDPYHYVVFTDVAQFLGWIKEKLIE